MFKTAEFVRERGSLNAGAGRPAFVVGEPNQADRETVTLLVLHNPEDREANGPFEYRFNVPRGGKHFPHEPYYVTSPGDRPTPQVPEGYAVPQVANSGADVAALTAQVSQLTDLVTALTGMVKPAPAPAAPTAADAPLVTTDPMAAAGFPSRPQAAAPVAPVQAVALPADPLAPTAELGTPDADPKLGSGFPGLGG